MPREYPDGLNYLVDASGSIINPAIKELQQSMVTNQTNGLQKTQLVDANGDPVDTGEGLAVVVKSEVETYVSLGVAFSSYTEYTLTSNGVIYPLICFENPIGTDKRFIMHEVQFGSLTEGKGMRWRLHYGATITDGGALQTPLNRLQGSPNTSVALYGSIPTVTDNGTIADILATKGSSTGSIHSETFSLSGRTILEAGFHILMTGQGNANNQDVYLNCIWSEVEVV